ncbi:MAG: DMT family transporter [Thermoplasmatales archaeon]|nr:MAG: DMT family transporter [Thermoplasmatales archaeon]
MFNKISYLYISLTVLFWGSTAAVGKLLLTNLNNFQLLFFISLFGTISLFIIVLIQKKIEIIKTYNLRNYCYFALMGFIGVFLYHALLFAGLSVAPASEVFIVNYTWPIWVVVFAVIIMKEKLNINKILAIIICFIGVYVVVTHGDFFNFSGININGDLFALAGAISYGLFSVMGQRYNYEVFTSMMFYFGFSFIYTLIFTVAFSTIPIVTSYEIIGLIWMGVFATGLAFAVWFLAIKHGDIIEMSNIVFITPFISLIYIYFLLGEEILLFSVIGLIIIILGIFLNNNWRKHD